MLTFDALYFSYDETAPLFSNVNCSFGENVFACIVGKNGSGKSTFAKLAVGILEPQRGSVRCNQEPVARANIGYLQQKKHFGEDVLLSVYEFVMMGNIRPRKLFFSGAESEVALWAIEQCGLSKKKDTPIRHLSGGQIQRALIARLMVMRPEIVVLDEPFESLDTEVSEILLHELHKLKSQMTIIMVSHNLEMINSLADEVYCISNHRGHHEYIEYFLRETKIPIKHICNNEVV